MSSDPSDTTDSAACVVGTQSTFEYDSESEYDLALFDEEYDTNTEKRGICLIFNHRNFIKETERIGTEYDVKALTNCFSNRGYNVIVHTDRTVIEVKRLLNEASKANHADYDSFVCCFLTHGVGKDKLCASDGTYSKQDVFELFTCDKCPTLSGKPKFFIIQACRGNQTDRGIAVQQIATDAGLGDFQPNSKPKTIPVWSDFLIAYSTMDGFISYRYSNGTPFILHLAKYIDKASHKIDMASILTQTNKSVSKYNIRTQEQPAGKQMPQFFSTLTAKWVIRDKGLPMDETLSSEYSDESFNLLPTSRTSSMRSEE